MVAGHFRGGRTGEVAYLIDGIPVNDVFNGSVSVTVENNAIRQLEVISGTFNAEYGSALSGVVNIVTKEGSSKFEGYAAAYVGNYFTQHSDIFYNINKANLDVPKELQFNLTVPHKGFRWINFCKWKEFLRMTDYLYGKTIF